VTINEKYTEIDHCVDYDILKVGELYVSARLGLFIITNLYTERTFTRNHVDQIGTCERLNFGDRVYKLYNDTRIREATDSDIEEYILNKLTKFDLNEQDFVTVDESGVTVYSDQEAVFLNKDAALKLRDILNRELN
jgi:hypothetical protein